MKFYAEFHRRDLAGNLAPGTGDRAIVQIDARLSDRSIRAIAADTCKRRGYEAYQMLRGSALRDARPVGRLVDVTGRSDLETVSEVINARKESQP